MSPSLATKISKVSSKLDRMQGPEYAAKCHHSY